MKLRVFNIDDDKDLREMIQEDLERDLAGVDVVSFEDIREAWNDAGRMDVAVIDMTTMSPVISGPAAAYAPIANLVLKHPHAHYIILSGVHVTFAEEVIERIKDCRGCEGVSIEYLCITQMHKAPGRVIEALKKMGWAQ